MICNTGIGLVPRVGDTVESYRLGGLYDGLFLFVDETTGTYWNHMTGEAMYGPLAGERLPLHNVPHSTVKQLLAQDPAALIAISEHPRVALLDTPPEERVSWLARLMRLGDRGLSRQFERTIRAEDARRPTMEMGIGIWDGPTARYYGLPDVETAGRALLDTFGGRTVLVYYDPTAYALVAQYTEADRVWWEDDVLRLSTGESIEDGLRWAADGSRVEVENPLQVFTRWYGFSLTFPHTEIYGER